MFCIRNTFMSHCKNLFKESTFKIRREPLMHLHNVCVRNCVETNRYTKPVNEIPVKEIMIPISYGQLAAKAWGQENGYPVLAIHGWMDNCGTFDKLIPMLNNSLYVIALDLPGSGFSCHKPFGCFYSYVDMIIAMKYAINFLGWQKFSIIGHSMGGALTQLFTAFYPDLVEKLILLDNIKPISLPPEKIPESFIKTIDVNMEIEKKLLQRPPVYSAESALERLLKGMHNEITPESGKILLQRGARESDCGTGLIFTRDLRLRRIENYYVCSTHTIQAFMSRIKSEMLIIKADNTHPAYMPRNPEEGKIFIDLYKQNCKRFSLETVEGNHFVHLNNPERVAPLINKFVST